MSWSVVATALPIAPSKNELSRSLCSSSSTSSGVVLCFSSIFPSSVRFRRSSFYPSPQLTEKRKTNTSTSRSTKQICRATSEYKFPDPIPEFAEAETEKFRTHLVKRLSKKDIYEDSVEEVVNVCTESMAVLEHSWSFLSLIWQRLSMVGDCLEHPKQLEWRSNGQQIMLTRIGMNGLVVTDSKFCS
ncbi:protein PLASTID REDOX INSENSITIVE 2, chloroplastic isoform X2 [Humulus lupulus]|uniref:protein PLASTID REDOX INSENSITIVE 2, chloroplastic isoform X2 n=1 Tax=Humulus lupulus TaxID=3486 RepID=UPI002B410767|nr:protein PLASTID REDOX INSENSITIVE 2, chloroplastic isoform X2 [Humulus lupulus]